MVTSMKVKNLSVAKNESTGEYMNMVTVETTQGHIFNIDLMRPYSLIMVGPTQQDIQELVSTVFDLEHRNLQAERAIRRMNTEIEAFISAQHE